MPAECLDYTYEITRKSRSAWDGSTECVEAEPIIPTKHRHRCVNDCLQTYSDPWASRYQGPSIKNRALVDNHYSNEHRERLDHALRTEIEYAKAMLVRSDDEDEDAPRFSKDAFSRAIEFLRAQSTQFRKMLGSFAPTPSIGPGPDGSVDLHWKKQGWELLVNIPADPGKIATFYGDNYGAQKIKGSFDPKTFNYGIIAWLMNN